MAATPPALQSWFVAFAALTGVFSFFPYRERALLPAPAANEQGLLAREISAQGTTDIVNDTIAGTTRQLARDTIGSAGARRLIPAQIRGTDVPGTTTLSNVLPSGSSTLPGIAGDAANAPGQGGAVNLAGVGGVPGAPGSTPGQTVNNPQINGPQGPAVLAGAASELLAAVVPEPSTWLMFIAGMMAIGGGLRRSRRAPVRRLQQS